jgi:hypothetical protein
MNPYPSDSFHVTGLSLIITNFFAQENIITDFDISLEYKLNTIKVKDAINLPFQF